MLSEREGEGRDTSNQLKEALDSTENANKVRETLKNWECMSLGTRLRMHYKHHIEYLVLYNIDTSNVDTLS